MSFVLRMPTRVRSRLEDLRSYFWNLGAALQASRFVSSRWRVRLLRWLGCDISLSAGVAPGVEVGSWRLHMDAESYVNVHCFLDGSADIHIGEYVRIGPHVKILTGTHTYAPSVLRRGPGSQDVRLPVRIERGAWIGLGAILLPGVVVREGCVVAAGAVVVRSTEPNGLYAGNPARRIRDLPVQ